MGRSRKKINLTGQRYGDLTVMEPAENIGKRTAWPCQCDCGEQVVAKTCHLRGGEGYHNKFLEEFAAGKKSAAECSIKRTNNKRAAGKAFQRPPGNAA